jgi:predicted DNA-binding transcriptional regulator AlpA
MTQEEFKRLPFLLTKSQVLAAVGYSPSTLVKMVSCGVLEKVRPAGSGQLRFRKVQVAMLMGYPLEEEVKAFDREPLLMKLKAVHVWTGYAEPTVRNIARAGGLRWVRPAGMGAGKFRKAEVAQLLGLAK